MQKNDSRDWSTDLHDETFDVKTGRRIAARPMGTVEFKVEEFGISAREELTPDVLTKPIAYEYEDPKKVEVFLCYNWKRQVPFVIVKRQFFHPRRSHDPGCEVWFETKYQDTTMEFYSPAELSLRQPEIAAIINAL